MKKITAAEIESFKSWKAGEVIAKTAGGRKIYVAAECAGEPKAAKRGFGFGKFGLVTGGAR